ncbi:hypothetical protein PMI05_01535 [Brevibacillus sp. BC25]|nr:hypothetical protein PMI05_01535 [Brevibacillus sp. BC25]
MSVHFASERVISFNLWTQIQIEAQTKYPSKRYKEPLFVLGLATIMANHLLESLHTMTKKIKSECHLLETKCVDSSNNYCPTLFS